MAEADNSDNGVVAAQATNKTDNSTQQPATESAAPSQSGKVSKLVIVAIFFGGVGLTLVMFEELRDIIAPSFLAINLLVAAFPIYTVMTKYRSPRWLAAVATLLVVLLIMLVGVGALIWSVSQMVATLLDYTPQFTTLYNDIIEWLGTLGVDQNSILDQLRTISPSSVANVVLGLVSNVSGIASVVTVLVVAMVFMGMDLPSIEKRFRITGRVQSTLADSLGKFAVGIRSYWLVTSVFGLIVAAFDGVLLMIMSVPLPLVWAVLSFITNYIPNIGFVIGLIPPALIALVSLGPTQALIVIALYSIINFVIQSIIQPKFTGDAVGVTPIVSFLSLMVWAAIFGPVGALIALPFTLMIKAILIGPDPKLQWINAWIDSNPKDALQHEKAPKSGAALASAEPATE